MNITSLLILGTVRHLGRAHGYSIRGQLDEWRVETWTTVRSGSVYHALGQLHKEGKLVVVGKVVGARGAEKTIFSLTPSGENTFYALLEKALQSFDLPQISAGIAFISELPDERARSLLEALHQRLDDNREYLIKLKDNTPNGHSVPRTSDLLDLWAGYLESTARSVDQLRQKIQSEAADFPGPTTD